MNKNTVIVTVGISLLGTLKHHNISLDAPADEIAGKLRILSNHEQACAEISSIYSLLKEDVIKDKENLYLLTSDTEQGKKINEILKCYFQSVFQRIQLFTIENLNGTEPELFKEEGLRNLVKTIVQITRLTPGKETACVINATGGYKAQVAFAGLIGQVLQIPVYYQFEGFTSVIQLPEMPVTLDYKLWLEHFRFFHDLYDLGIMSENLLPASFDLKSLHGLVETSRGQIRLSSVGLLMHEALWSRFQQEGSLFLPASAVKKEEIAGLSRLPLGLQTVLQSIYQLSFVTSVQITKTKQDLSGPMSFSILDSATGILQGVYGQDQQTWIFRIETTATNESEANAVCVELYQRFQLLTEHKQSSSVEFVLVRHGQHVGEHENRIEGFADFELTETGHRQAQLAANKLVEKYPKPDILYSSSLTRATQTATHIGNKVELQPILLDDLRAMNYGKPGGLTKDEAMVLYPLTSKPVIFDRTYEGESEVEFNRRVIELFYELVHKHQGKTVYLVTHGRAINVILREVLNLPLSHDFRVDSADTSIHHFVMKDSQTLLRCVNNAEHLAELEKVQ